MESRRYPLCATSRGIREVPSWHDASTRRHGPLQSHVGSCLSDTRAQRALSNVSLLTTPYRRGRDYYSCYYMHRLGRTVSEADKRGQYISNKTPSRRAMMGRRATLGDSSGETGLHLLSPIFTVVLLNTHRAFEENIIVYDLDNESANLDHVSATTLGDVKDLRLGLPTCQPHSTPPHFVLFTSTTHSSQFISTTTRGVLLMSGAHSRGVIMSDILAASHFGASESGLDLVCGPSRIQGRPIHVFISVEGCTTATHFGLSRVHGQYLKSVGNPPLAFNQSCAEGCPWY
jgi:hypothetical protein